MNTNIQSIPVNKEFINLSPYPLIIPLTEWSQLPEWQKAQLEHDNNNVKLSNSYRVEFSNLENNSITFRYDFKKSRLLYKTPKDWVLPKSRFNIHTDFKRIIYSLGESWTLFKFINQSNKGQPWYKAYEKRIITKFTNYIIIMEITLVKPSKTITLQMSRGRKNNENNENNEVIIQEGQTLSLPTISVDYSDYILHLTNKESGTNYSDYYQNIYFPMMLKLGYASYEQYEDYNEKFDKENNPGWTYLIVKVNYKQSSKIDLEKQKL